MKHVCVVCGYVYDDDIENKTFEELSKDWRCPVCGAHTTAFVASDDDYE